MGPTCLKEKLLLTLIPFHWSLYCQPSPPNTLRPEPRKSTNRTDATGIPLISRGGCIRNWTTRLSFSVFSQHQSQAESQAPTSRHPFCRTTTSSDAVSIEKSSTVNQPTRPDFLLGV